MGTVVHDSAFMKIANKLSDSKATWTTFQEAVFDGARKKAEGDFLSAIPNLFAFLEERNV